MRPAADRRDWWRHVLTRVLTAMLFGLELAYAQRISCHTTKGILNIMLHQDWAPEAHSRFLELLQNNFFSDQVFYGVKRRDLIQFGISADPDVTRTWQGKVIPDDPPRPELQPMRGQLSFQADPHGRRETRLAISDSRTRTPADYGPFERPFGQILNPEILDKLYDGYGDLSRMIPAMVAHGGKSLARYTKLDRIHRCDLQYTALEAEVQAVVTKAQVASQLDDVSSKSHDFLKEQALDGFMKNSGEDAAQLFDSNIRSPRADPVGTAAKMHDTVFKALSKTAAESIRVLSGAPDSVPPCLPTPDGATPDAPAVKGMPLALKNAVQSQVRKQVEPNVICEMKLVASNTGCYGNRKYQEHYIAGAEWTSERGGQYRLRGLDLQQSFAACVQDDECNFIWMSILDEIAARGWGSRALHECKRRPAPDHNLYEKVCTTAEEKRKAEGVPLSFEQASDTILARIQQRAGKVPFSNHTIEQVFVELDKDGDTQISPTEMMRLGLVVDKRWGMKRKAESPRNTKKKKDYTPERYALSEQDILRLFDEDEDGKVSRAERILASTFMQRKTEL